MEPKIIHTANDTCGTALIVVSSSDQAYQLIKTIAAQYPSIDTRPIITETARMDALAVEWVNRISLHARGGMAEWLADHEADGITERVFKVHLMDAYQRGIIGKKGGFYCVKG